MNGFTIFVVSAVATLVVLYVVEGIAGAILEWLAWRRLPKRPPQPFKRPIVSKVPMASADELREFELVEESDD